MQSSDSEVVVTVIIPAFDPGDLILEALESVYQQTFKSWEVIVVDDASSDGLRERLLPHMDRINYIRFDENRGPSAARNEAIRLARGRYVAPLDADDYWDPRRLEVLVSYLEDHPEISMVTGDLLYVGWSSEEEVASFFSAPLTSFRDNDQDVHILRENFPGGCLVYRKELFQNHGFYDESHRRAEDWDRNIAFIFGGERAGFVPQPLTYIRYRPGSLTSFGPWETERLRVVKRWTERANRPEAVKAGRDTASRIEWDIAKSACLQGGSSEVRTDLLRLALKGPADVRLKALLWAILPAALMKQVHSRRFGFIDRYGGHWSLEMAGEARLRRDRRAERNHVLAAVMFGGFSLKTRLLALAWVLIPFARRPIAELIYPVERTLKFDGGKRSA